MWWPPDRREPLREHLTDALLALQDAQRRAPSSSPRSAALRVGVSSARAAMRTLGLGRAQPVPTPDGARGAPSRDRGVVSEETGERPRMRC
jgi:hypothetical protein